MIRYPNGKSYQPIQQIGTKRISGESSYSNRGMTLEADLNETNQYYLVNGIAVIHKKPTLFKLSMWIIQKKRCCH